MENEDGIVDFACCVAMRLAQRFVVEAQCAQRFSGAEVDVVECDVGVDCLTLISVLCKPSMRREKKRGQGDEDRDAVQ